MRIPDKLTQPDLKDASKAAGLFVTEAKASWPLLRRTVLSPEGLPAEPDKDRQLEGIPAGSAISPVAWWSRDFPGQAAQVREARHWIEDLLPECGPLQDFLLLASELCANAVLHTRSREAGGRFSVDVEWGPDLARMVIGDQGALTVPVAAGKPDDTWTREAGRGLWLVDELADDWGTGCHPAGRVVWVEVGWQARGGLPLQVPGGADAVAGGTTAMRKAFPGATIWWGHQTLAWWAALPGITGAGGLVSSPTAGGLGRLLADARPHSCRDNHDGSARAVAAGEALALAAPDQPENTQGR
jgi:anti-sigma regulatory factor (Ser/Thr protein kinase)